MLSNRSFLIVFYLLALPFSSQANEFHDFSYYDYLMPSTCPIPSYSQVDRSLYENTDDTITIEAKKSVLEKNQLAKFTGGVTLIGPSETIVASEIEINREDYLVNAKGNIHFSNESVDIFSDQLKSSDSAESTTMTNTAYQLTSSLGHGKADKISIHNQGKIALLDSSYTTCFSETPEWLIKASTINILPDEKRLEAYNVSFSVLDVPVLYLPYFSMPITNEKQSGFLTPKISTSNNTGLLLEAPFFIDISNAMDATLTPRYMSARGFQLLTEFRYLANEQYGELHLEYLDQDDDWKASDSWGKKEARYLARLEHVGTFSERFRAYVDVTTIGDDNYLVDVGSEQYNENDTYLYQIGELAYFADNWHSSFKLQDFEVLGNHTQSYRTVPHIEFDRASKLNFANALFDIHSELTRFETTEENKVEAERYHVEAGLMLPISEPAWFVNSELKVMHTYYRQRNIQEDSDYKQRVSRTLPKVRIHGGFFLEREANLFGDGYLQTIEPQLQYLYVGDKDQSNIGLYDTTALQDDYDGLFRDKRYSGLDRIAHANQYSWGVTSRMSNAKNIETFRFSVGRIIYLNENENSTTTLSNENSALATELYFRINRKLQLNTSIQYDTKNELTSTSQTNLDYRFDRNSSIQLNHRYVRNVSSSEEDPITIGQVSAVANTKISANWHLIGRVTKDLQDNRNIESFAGVEYKNCCWGIRAAFHRHININLDDDVSIASDSFDNSFKIEFVYNGLADSSNSNGVLDMLRSSIFGYKRPYFLNN